MNVKMSLVVVALSLAPLLALVASDPVYDPIPDTDADDFEYWEKSFCTYGFQRRLDYYGPILKGKKTKDLNQGELIVLNMYRTRKRKPELCTPEHVDSLNSIADKSPSSCIQYLGEQVASLCEYCMQFEYNKLKSSQNEQLKSAANILEFLYSKAGGGKLGTTKYFELEVATLLAEYLSDPNRDIKRSNRAGMKKSFGKIFDEHVQKACKSLIKETKTMQRFEGILKARKWKEEDWSKESSFWKKRRITCKRILSDAEPIKKYLDELQSKTEKS